VTSDMEEEAEDWARGGGGHDKGECMYPLLDFREGCAVFRVYLYGAADSHTTSAVLSSTL